MLDKFGELILRFLSALGGAILFIPKIPQKLRSVDRERIKEKIGTDDIKENVSRVKDNLKREEKISKNSSNKEDQTISKVTSPDNNQNLKKAESDVILISTPFTSKEKEDTIFRLQLLSAAFLILSVIYLFNFLSFIIYLILAVLLVGYILYVLFNRVKVMYGSEFPAYRDFFFMYLAVGVILVLVGTNSNLVMSFSYSQFPSLTILIFAIIAVLAVYLVFRMRYHRDYTYGVIIETGNKIAYVKVEYDIRSNVKPDIYVVDNMYGAREGDTVKLATDQKLFSNSGNKPLRVIETVNKI